MQRICLAIMLFFSAVALGQNGNLSPIFDISPDNNTLALAIAEGNTSNIYTYSLTTNKLEALTEGTGYYSRPVFSPQGDKLIFLSKNTEKETSDLCAFDIATKKITKLSDGKTYVTEAAFMPGGNEIIYCGAGTITNYSPLARKAPHDIDLYLTSPNGSTPKKMTNFSAYSFSNISPNATGDTLLCKLIVKGVEGIYLLSLADTVKTKIEAINNPRPAAGPSFYGSPAYAPDNTQLSFIAPYQVYLMNFKDKKCEEVWSTFGKDKQAMPIFSKFSNTGQKLYFSVIPIVNRQYTANAELYFYDQALKKVVAVTILR